jgi:hypothetical protein
MIMLISKDGVTSLGGYRHGKKRRKDHIDA